MFSSLLNPTKNDDSSQSSPERRADRHEVVVHRPPEEESSSSAQPLSGTRTAGTSSRMAGNALSSGSKSLPGGDGHSVHGAEGQGSASTSGTSSVGHKVQGAAVGQGSESTSDTSIVGHGGARAGAPRVGEDARQFSSPAIPRPSSQTSASDEKQVSAASTGAESGAGARSGDIEGGAVKSSSGGSVSTPSVSMEPSKPGSTSTGAHQSPLRSAGGDVSTSETSSSAVSLTNKVITASSGTSDSGKKDLALPSEGKSPPDSVGGGSFGAGGSSVVGGGGDSQDAMMGLVESESEEDSSEDERVAEEEIEKRIEVSEATKRYRAKYLSLKRKYKKLEEDNLQIALRLGSTRKRVQDLRDERSLLLEELAKFGGDEVTNDKTPYADPLLIKKNVGFPRSAVELFVQDHADDVREDEPQLKEAQLEEVLKIMWKELPSAKKEAYYKKFDELMRTYRDELNI